MNIREAIKSWNIEYLTKFLYQREKEGYQEFFDFLKKRCSNQKEVFYEIRASLCLNKCSFCLFKTEYMIKYPLNLISLQSIPNHLNIILSFGFKNKIEKIYKDFYKDIPFFYWIDMSCLLFNTYEDISIFLHEKIKGLFIDYFPLSDELCTFYNIRQKRERYFSCLTSITKKKDVYLNYYIDLPGQSFKDILNDLGYYLHLNLKGIRLIPFISEDMDEKWKIFDSTCILNFLKILSIIRYYKEEWEIFIDNKVDLLGGKLKEISFNIGANNLITFDNQFFDVLFK